MSKNNKPRTLRFGDSMLRNSIYQKMKFELIERS